MSIISQETWVKMPKEEKEKIIYDYNMLRINLSTGLLEDKYSTEQLGKIKELEDMFGKENLQSKIRTWDDIIKLYPNYEKDCQNIRKYTKMVSNKLQSKLLATYKIAKIIEVGYGVVTKEEWRDPKICNWYITIGMESNPDGQIVITFSNLDWRQFISFHTKEQAKEFLSHAENVKLVKQYYMI